MVDEEFESDLLDESDEVAAEDGGDEVTSRRATATKAKPKSTAPAGKKQTKSRTPDRPGIFARFVNFVREVVAELRKVIWPTRSELARYTTVVVIFVVIMLTIVGLLDYGFAKGVLWVFGDKTANIK